MADKVRMKRFLERHGYRLIIQMPHQHTVEIEEQKISLPFTNSFCEVLLIRIGDTWCYLEREFKDSLAAEQMLAKYYGFVKGQTKEDPYGDLPDEELGHLGRS